MSPSRKRRLSSLSANGLFYAVALGAASFTGSLFAFAPVPAQALAQSAGNVQITSEIKIERTQTDSRGRETVVLTDPNAGPVVPGDSVIIVNSYQNVGNEPATNFISVNPVNPNLAFVSVAEEWAELSVDGGKTWGKLNELTVPSDPAEQQNAQTPAASPPLVINRPASPGDVTHIRWSFPEPIAPRAKGTLSFRAVVR